MNTILCGIDEAGRGCIAGSLFIVAVVLQEKFVADFQRLGIKDSKQLSFMQRNAIAIRIMQYLHTHNGFYYIVNFNAQQIDEFGLKTCMQRGLQKLCDFAKTRGAVRIIFDGNTNFGIIGIDTIIKGDSKDTLIGAASILAKYKKDEEMLLLHRRIPQYNFKNNKGYLTKEHKEKILQYGYSDIHRKSYRIKSFESNLFYDKCNSEG